MPFFPRDELLRALHARMNLLDSSLESTAFLRASIKDGADGTDGEVPEHVREILDFLSAQTRAELEWTRGFQKRVRDGGYRFEGEAGFPALGPGRGAQR
jgi:hypothetical protein